MMTPGRSPFTDDPTAEADDVWSPAPVTYAFPVAGSRRRGQWLSWTVLVLAVVVAGALGVATYLGLVTVRSSAADPWGTAWTWPAVCAGAALAAVGAFLLGVVALVVSRPRFVAALATLLALVLPVVALWFALRYGVAETARHPAQDGASLADLLDPDTAPGPVREVLGWVARVLG